MLHLLPVLTLLAAPPVPGPTVDTLHGVTIADPYRALEELEAGTAYTKEENTKTDAWLDAHKVPGMKARLEELFTLGFVARPAVGGSSTFFVRMEGKQEQPTLMVKTAKTEKVLLDLTKEDPTGKTALDWFFPSQSGKLLAYGISKNGDEASVLHVMDVATGKVLTERIPDTRWCDLSWLKDDSGFLYRRFPAGDRYNPRIYLHRVGQAWEKDELIYEVKGDKTWWPGTMVSEDGKSAVITVSRGWSASDLYWMDLATRAVKPLVVGEAALFENAFVRDGKVFTLTNLGAPRSRLVRINPANPAKDAWETLIPEGPTSLKGFLPLKGKLVVMALDRAVSKLTVHDNNGKLLSDVTLPGVGSVNGLDGSASAETAVLEFTGFTTPPRLLSLDVSKAPKVTPLADVKTTVDLSRFVTEQVEYLSYDGTRVPMFLIHGKDMKRDGKNKVLLNGYGGFNVNITPSFARRYLYWLDQGGVLAVANLRGGGELGEDWHEAGRKAHKHQVFRDFEYAMRWLIAENVTRPDRLVITGGSNGGLLMGAQITEFPHLFAASYAAVGLFDMVRFHRWPPAELWVDEYGSSDNAADVAYLWAYSPYHQVLPGVRYPATFIATAMQDTRVTWIHSAKFAARLQAAQAGDAPILLHVEQAEGHGQGKGRSDQVEDAERMFTFFFGVVGKP